jgi:Leu/Phe-tRNA-protein transferase
MLGLSTYEVALRYACSKPNSVIKLSLPNNKVLSIAQNTGEKYQVSLHGNSAHGTVEAWDGEDQIGYLDGVALANYILERAK